MSGLADRRRADLDRLRRLAEGSDGQLVVLDGSDAGRLHLRVNRPTAGGPDYPQRALSSFDLAIDLPARYPFEPPTARLTGARLFHPNVFESGVVCVGSRWRPGEGLDLYVIRLVRLLLFDPMLVNLKSVAHSAAGHWYARARRQHPQAFPSATLDWRPVPERIVRRCPACSAALRLPVGRHGDVECPKCGHVFEART